MSQPLYAMTEETARRVRLLLGEQPGGGDSPRHRPRPPAAVLVRCDSATAAGGSGAAAQCYPATVLLDESGATAQTDGAPVWLTVWDDAGAAAEPVAGRVYPAVPAGRLTVEGDERQRAFGGTGGGGVDYGDATATPSGTVTVDDTWTDATDFELVLPGAGTYEVTCHVSAYGLLSAFGGGYSGIIYARLYNVTAGAVVTGTSTVVASVQATGRYSYGHAAITTIVTVTGSTTLRVQLLRPSGVTWTTVGVAGSPPEGNCTRYYVKLA